MLRLIVMIVMTLGASDVGAQEIDFVPVVVAQQELPRGFLLTEANVLGEGAVVRIALYPADNLPASAIQSLEELIGTVLRTDIPAENPLVRHYLFPDPRLRPDADVPFPISPPEMRVVRDYGAYREMSFENEGQFLLPARLAAGDSVDIVSSTALGNAVQDESSIVLENIVVARISGTSIAFSASEEDLQTLSEFSDLKVPMTVLLRAPGADETEFDDFNSGSNRINWEFLTTRDDDPLVIPPGADMTTIGQ